MERAKLGGIEISVVTSERVNHRAESTDKPVERGQDVSDHTKKRPPIIDLVGVIVGEGAADKLNKLVKYQKEGTMIKFIHRTSMDNAFIEDINTIHEAKNADGYQFNIRLKQIRIATAKELEINVVSPTTMTKSKKTDTQVKPKTNAGTQQLQEKAITTPVRQLSGGEWIEENVTPGGTMAAMRKLMDIYQARPKQYRDPNIMDK